MSETWTHIPDTIERLGTQYLKLAYWISTTNPEHPEQWYIDSPELGRLPFHKAAATAATDGPLWSNPMKPGAESALAPVAGALGKIQEPWGGPNPITSAIVLGLLGTGLGYGGGALAERLLPEKYFNPGRLRKVTGALGGLLGAGLGATFTPWQKQAENDPLLDSMASNSGGAFVPDVHIDAWKKAIERDPYMPAQAQAVAVGLPVGAGVVSGSRWVSPYDIARVAAGAGWGGALGYGIGRAAQLVTGMTPAGVKAVQNTGILAGAMKALLPGLF